MYSSKRIPERYKLKFSQNFIKSSGLAEEFVRLSEVKPTDVVIEIGPGKGIITKALAQKVKFVYGIEKDLNLSKKLNGEAFVKNNVKIINADFLNCNLPKADSIVGNIPFALTSKIINLLLNPKLQTGNIHLIMQREAAFRLIGEKKESLFSLQFKPWFEIKLAKQFKRDDFYPAPNVDIVQVNIKKRDPPIIQADLQEEYLDFISYFFLYTNKHVGSLLHKLFTYQQIKVIKQKYKINTEMAQSGLNFEQWVGLFDSFINFANEDRQNIIIGSHRKLKSHQQNLEKSFRTRNIFKRY